MPDITSNRTGTTSLGEIVRIRREIEKRRVALLRETDAALSRIKALLDGHRAPPPSELQKE